MSTPNLSEKSEELFLLIANATELSAAGLDVRLIDAVHCPQQPTGNGAIESANSTPKVLIGRLVTSAVKNEHEVRVQLGRISQALKALGKMPIEKIEAALKQLQPDTENQDRDAFKQSYGVISIEEMAHGMQCTPQTVSKKEAAGEIFAAGAPGRTGMPLYPKFQLDERVDKFLLEHLIREYRDAGVSTTLLWNFLRTPQKIFAGFTPMEMMLGATFPVYEALAPEEKSKIFRDVVSEELSRIGPIWSCR